MILLYAYPTTIQSTDKDRNNIYQEVVWYGHSVVRLLNELSLFQCSI